jgi:hypothetical protein
MCSRNLNIISFLLAWRNTLSAHGEPATAVQELFDISTSEERTGRRHPARRNIRSTASLGLATFGFVGTTTELTAAVFQHVANP